MKKICSLFLILGVYNFAQASIICEKSLGKDKAINSMNEFVIKNSLIIPEKYSVIFNKHKKSCHYNLTIIPNSDSDPVWQQHGNTQIVLNPDGMVVSFSRFNDENYSCPNMNLKKDYFSEKIKILRAKNSELPKKPKKFNTTLYVIKCEYVYIEHMSAENVSIIPLASQINKFRFDYFGELFDYKEKKPKSLK